MKVAISGGVFANPLKDEWCAKHYVPTDNFDPETCADYPYTVERWCVVTVGKCPPRVKVSWTEGDGAVTNELAGESFDVPRGMANVRVIITPTHMFTVDDDSDSPKYAEQWRQERKALFAKNREMFAAVKQRERETGERDSGIAHTVHSCAYDLANRQLAVCVQERATPFRFALGDPLFANATPVCVNGENVGPAASCTVAGEGWKYDATAKKLSISEPNCYNLAVEESTEVEPDFGSNVTLWTTEEDLFGTALYLYGAGATPDWDPTNCPSWRPQSDEINGIEIGADITHVGSWAFGDCTSDEIDLFVRAKEPPTLGEQALPPPERIAQITVPSGSLGEYKQSDDWRPYIGLIVAEPEPGSRENPWTVGVNVEAYVEDGTLRLTGSGQITTKPWSGQADSITAVVKDPGVTGMDAAELKTFKNLRSINGIPLAEFNATAAGFVDAGFTGIAIDPATKEATLSVVVRKSESLDDPDWKPVSTNDIPVPADTPTGFFIVSPAK